MKKRVLGIVAASAFAIAAFGAPVAADKGGVANDNACHGKVVSFLVALANESDVVGNGAKAVADFFGVSVQEGQAFVRDVICS